MCRSMTQFFFLLLFGTIRAFRQEERGARQTCHAGDSTRHRRLSHSYAYFEEVCLVATIKSLNLVILRLSIATYVSTHILSKASLCVAVRLLLLVTGLTVSSTTFAVAHPVDTTLVALLDKSSAI